MLDKYLIPVPAAELWTPGTIIHHKPRDSYYTLLFRTMIKIEKGKWAYGWVYQETKLVHQVHDEMVFEQDSESLVFTREFSQFDSDFEVTLKP